MGMGRPGAGESIARAMQIIEAVGDLGPGATSREIADRLDVPPANIYRLLNTLAVEEYLVRTADLRGFALGNRLNTMVHSAVTPYMSSRAQELCEKFRASVRFGVYVMHFRPATLRIVDMDPDHPLVAEHEMIRSLHASAAGKLLLAADSQWRELLPPTLPALTPSTVTDSSFCPAPSSTSGRSCAPDRTTDSRARTRVAAGSSEKLSAVSGTVHAGAV